MNQVKFSDLSKIINKGGVAGLSEVLPLQIVVNCEPIFVLDKVDSVVVLSDLHPRVQHRLRGIELRARSGMPKVEKVEPTILFDNKPSL
jgi:hypothetical protein